jgi:hypothetical protein
MDYVLGYTCFNDVTSEYFKEFMQQRVGTLTMLDLSMSSFAGKATDGFGPTGPWIVTKDEIPDVYDLLIYPAIDKWNDHRLEPTRLALRGPSPILPHPRSARGLHAGRRRSSVGAKSAPW